MITIQPYVALPAVAAKTTLPSARQISADEPAKSADTVTISQAARDALAASASSSAIPADSEPFFKQAMAEKFAGGNAIRSMVQNDPSNPLWAKNVDFLAQHDFTKNPDVLYDISHTMPGASGSPKIDGILRYSSGEIVTTESQAYVDKQTAIYQNQLRELISTEKAKGTSSADILLKTMDLQDQQPARFRSMAAWPIASDFANAQASATTDGVKSS